MKRARRIKHKLFAVINVLLSDEFFVSTYDHKYGANYDHELRSSFPIGYGLQTDINSAVLPWLADHHDKKQLRANAELIGKINKGEL